MAVVLGSVYLYLSSCNVSEDIIPGIYISNVGDFPDTLKIFKDKSYSHFVIIKQKKIVNNATWEYDGRAITFNHFITYIDNDTIQGYWTSNIHKQINGEIYFMINPDMDLKYIKVGDNR